MSKPGNWSAPWRDCAVPGAADDPPADLSADPGTRQRYRAQLAVPAELDLPGEPSADAAAHLTLRSLDADCWFLRPENSSLHPDWEVGYCAVGWGSACSSCCAQRLDDAALSGRREPITSSRPTISASTASNHRPSMLGSHAMPPSRVATAIPSAARPTIRVSRSGPPRSSSALVWPVSWGAGMVGSVPVMIRDPLVLGRYRNAHPGSACRRRGRQVRCR